MRTGVLAATLLASAFAQPSVQNAAIEKRQAPAAFRSFVKALVEEQTAAAWIGWAVKAGPERGESCCWHSGTGYSARGCWLEGVAAGAAPIQRAVPIQLEGAATVHVLIRVENKQVTKIRGFSADCELDAGGLRFIWLTEVPSRESIAYLAEFREKREPEALHAIAMHADPAAMGLLSDTARKNSSAHVRGIALHLLAREAAERAVPVIRDALANDPEMKVKERAVFAFIAAPPRPGCAAAHRCGSDKPPSRGAEKGDVLARSVPRSARYRLFRTTSRGEVSRRAGHVSSAHMSCRTPPTATPTSRKGSSKSQTSG